MTIQDIEKIARFSLEFDIRPDKMKEAEERQKRSIWRTEKIFYYNFLYLLTVFLDAKFVIETGTLHGGSAMQLTKAERVVTIDIDPNSGNFIQGDIIRHIGDSLSFCLRDYTRIDFLFMDSIDSYDHCKK